MTIREQLLGTSWRLKTFQSEDKNGELLYPLGEDAEGIIIFTSEQETSVQIMAKKRKDEASLDLYNTEGEKEMARFGYHAYSGPFDLDEEKGHLTTHVKMSLLEVYVGTDQVRAAKIDGDKLYLSNVEHPERKLVWERI